MSPLFLDEFSVSRLLSADAANTDAADQLPVFDGAVKVSGLWKEYEFM